MDDREQRQRIVTWMAACLVVVALTADIAELVLEWLGIGLVINVVTTPAYTFLFWLWFMMLGVPFVASPKRFFTLAATCLAELVPALDAMGGFFWTAGIIILVVMVRLEDKGGIVGELSGATMGIMATRYKTFKGDFNNLSAGRMDTKRARVFKSNMAISRGELASEAIKRNPKFSQNQYERGTSMVSQELNENVLNLKEKYPQLAKPQGGI